MPITTIDQNNPQLQRYGSATVSGDLAAQLAQQQQNASMVGQDLFPGMQVPQEGDNLLEFLANLHFGGQSQLASDLAEMNGIPAQDFRSLVTEINTQTAKSAPWLTQQIGNIGNTVEENPALLFAAPLALGALGGAFGGAAAGGTGGTGLPGLGGTGGTTGSFINSAGEMVVTGSQGAGGALGNILGNIGSIATGDALGGVMTGPNPVGPISSTGTPLTGLPGLTSSSSALDNILGNVNSIATGDPLGGVMTGPNPLGPISNTGAPIAAGGGIASPVIPNIPSGGSPPVAAPPVSQGTNQGPPQSGGGGLGLSNLGLPDWLTLAGLAGSALQGNQDQTTSRTNEPPAYLAPYLQQAAGAAQTQYGQGNYVAPVQQSAIDYGTNVLNGNYLNSNPYLDATFNKAAGAVTNAVQSNFGRAGRDVRGPDAAGIASGQYSDLAASIYGGNYQAERDRMQQIVPQANQLGAVTNPSQSLDDYIARLRNIGGNSGTATSTTPTQNNWWAGLAGLGLALQPGG